MLVQATPNPNALKVTVNRVVAPRSVTYRDAAGAEAPWARELLGITGITQVFALNNFLSITKASGIEWETIVPQVEAIVKRAFA